MNLNGKGYYAAAAAGLVVLAAGLGFGCFTGDGSSGRERDASEITEPEETAAAAEERFGVTTVNIFSCGHTIEQYEGENVTAGEAESEMNKYGGYDYELKDGRMTLYRELDYCCPEHYFTGEKDGKIAVFKANGDGFEKNEVCLLNVPASGEYSELAQGMSFSSLEEINLYIEGIEGCEGEAEE